MLIIKMLREEEHGGENILDTGSFKNYSKINFTRFSLIGILAALILYLISLKDYLLFHSLAESFSIIISCGIFMFIWNSRRYIDNNFFIVIGIAYLFIAFLDLIHTFAYAGVQIIPGHTANLPTQIWIASRFLQSITLLAAPFFIDKKIRTFNIVYVYTLVTVIIVISIFYWRIFPLCYIEGYGLTPFKKVSEYIISLILLLSIYNLVKKKNSFDGYIFHLILSSIIITIVSELSFTLYVSTVGLFNLVGHLLRIVSFYLMYRAIIVVGLQNPFDLLFGRLRQKEKDLRLTRFSVDRADDLMLWINTEGYITDVNDTTVKKLNYTKDEIVGFPYSKVDKDFDLVKFKEAKNKTFTEEHYFSTKKSNEIPMEVEFNFLEYEGKNYYCAIARDITEKKLAREQMQLSLTEKVTLLKEIHHRIKNNLQVISSLLRFQSSYIKDDETRKMFDESQSRIKSMALIHEKLYLSKDLSHINFSEYIHELVSSLLSLI